MKYELQQNKAKCQKSTGRSLLFMPFMTKNTSKGNDEKYMFIQKKI